MATFVWRGNNRTWSDFSAAAFRGYGDGTTVGTTFDLPWLNAASGGASGASGPWNWYEVGFYDEGRNPLEPAHRGSTKGCSFGLTHDIDSYWGITSNWLLELPGGSGNGNSDVYYATTSRVPHRGDVVKFKYVGRDEAKGLTFSIPLSPILFGGRGASGSSADVWVAQAGGFGGTLADTTGALAEVIVEPSYFTHDDPDDIVNWGDANGVDKMFVFGVGRGYVAKFKPATEGVSGAGGYRGGTWGFEHWGKSIASNQTDLFPNTNVNGNSAEAGKLFWRGISLSTEKLNVFGPEPFIPLDELADQSTYRSGITSENVGMLPSKFNLYGLKDNVITNLYIRAAEFHFGSSSAVSIGDYFSPIRDQPGSFINLVGRGSGFGILRLPDRKPDFGYGTGNNKKERYVFRNLTLTEVSINPIYLASQVEIGTETPQAITGIAYGPFMTDAGADVKSTTVSNVYRSPVNFFGNNRPSGETPTDGGRRKIYQSLTAVDENKDRTGTLPRSVADAENFAKDVRERQSLTISNQNSTSPFSPVRTKITSLQQNAENTIFGAVSGKPITVSPGSLQGPDGNGVTTGNANFPTFGDSIPRGFNGIVNVKSGCTVDTIACLGGRFEVHDNHPGGVSFDSVTGDQSVTVIRGRLGAQGTIDQRQGPNNFRAFVIGTAGGNTAGVKAVGEGAEVLVPQDIFIRTSPASTVFSEGTVSITSGYNFGVSPKGGGR